MADLLIKGMDMPQNCDECCLAKMESEFHGICTAIRNDVCYVYPDKGKPDWCPLVEVPTHGRLIDADKVPYFSSAPWKAMTTQSEIEKMPTVIEASEVEQRCR